MTIPRIAAQAAAVFFATGALVWCAVTGSISGTVTDPTGAVIPDAVVTAACPSITSQNPIEVYVYDGRDRKAPLTRLGKIGAGLDLTKIKIVDTMGPEIRVEGEGLSAKAALCCPDLYITETWRWNGHQLVRLTGIKMPLSKANAS